MARKRYSGEDELKILREIDMHLHDGMNFVSACRKVGASEKTYYYWQKKFGGMGRPQLSEMRALQKESERLKKIVAELQLGKLILKKCRRITPEMPRSYLSQTPENTNDPIDNSPEAVTPAFASFDKSIPQAVTDLEDQMWCPYFKDVTSDLVKEAHELRLLVSTWTINEPKDLERVIDAGVDSIVTDYPTRAQRILSSHNLR